MQQIADLADINRSTFYTHYYDKYDLLERWGPAVGGNKGFIHDEEVKWSS